MIKIVTDSTSYMTKDYAQEHGIRVIPLNILIGDKSIKEDMPEGFNGIFDILLAESEVSKSSQPAPQDFKEAFDKITGEGDEVLAITISSSLSGTYNSARLAATMCDESKITVIDSRACAQLMLLYIEEAVKLIKEGKSRAQIAAAIEGMFEVSSEMFVPLNLKHLIKGGRIGGVPAVIGTLLNVKPILAFKNGILACKKKVIGMQKAIRELINEIPQTVKKIYVMKIYKSEHFNMLRDMVKEKFPLAEIKQGDVGPVVGIHVGPGTIGVSFC